MSEALPTRAEAEALDGADPLAGFRSRFFVDAAGPVYVDGNSLGRLPKTTVERLHHVVTEEWGRGLVRSWSRWIDLAREVGDRIAADVVGARAGEVVVGDSTTIDLHKLAAAALADAGPARPMVVTDRGNFPTDRYVLEGLAPVRWLDEDPTVDDVDAACAVGDVALVSLSLVSYRSGAWLDLEGITAAAHRHGALVLWDLSHAAGAVPVDLDGSGADLAVGCTYKYLNGGPGAPAFLYVRTELQARLRQPIPGWFGAADQFAMGAGYVPAPGIDRFQVGTPAILGLASVDEGVRLTAEAGMTAIDAKRRALTTFLLRCFDHHLAPLGIELATPRRPERHGSHLSFRHPEAWRSCRALIEDLGVLPDFREPDLVRFGLTPLSTRFTDVWDAADALRRAVAERRYESFPPERSRVT
ncbi:MAG TPA: aminotransferase class V-fold PLP-dependent enzyme [Acidimicrobiales bacterium]|nr:aminotransferase class V-fold PLP-dependent enzyme [Acidimicrobiales bacterium]